MQVIDTATHTVTSDVSVFGIPVGIMMNLDGTRVYTFDTNGFVVEVDVATETLVRSFFTGTGGLVGRGNAVLVPTAPTLQHVFLDFGEAGIVAPKANTDVFGADGRVIMTLDKGPRAGFDPEDLGYSPGADRAALIQEVFDQVVADYSSIDGQDFDIRISLTPPDVAAFTTVSVVEGTYPDMLVPNVPPGSELRVEASFNRMSLNGGSTSGFFILLEDGRLRRPDTTVVEGVSFPEFKRIKVNAFGAAQQVDKGNFDKGKTAWVFVGEHDRSGAPEENLAELANSVSHELAHMVGIEHRDGNSDSIMGELESYGSNKQFSNTSRDKIVEVLPPCEGTSGTTSGLTSRNASIGDDDQYGTSEIGTLTGVPEEDAAAIFRRARSLLVTHITHDASFEYPLADITSSDPGDGAFTDVPLTNGTTATYSLDLTSSGITGAYVSGRIDIDVLNVADVLGGPDDLRLFVDGIEFLGAFDGVDQRLSDPDFAGYARSDRITFDLEDYLNLADIEAVLADGVLDVTLEVEGDTPFIAVDTIQAVVTDRGPDSIRACGNGTVNLAAGKRTDVLYLNGTSGDELRTVTAASGETVWASLLLPPAGGPGKYVLHMNTGMPESAGVTELPADIGTTCFPMLLPTATPVSVWNNIGKTNLVGSSNYFGAPIGAPERAPAIYLLLDGGDPTNLPVGTTVTIQGVIFDPATLSNKGVSATNGLILEIQ